MVTTPGVSVAADRKKVTGMGTTDETRTCSTSGRGRLIRTTLGVSVTAILAVAVVGCGSSAKPSPATSIAAATGSSSAAAPSATSLPATSTGELSTSPAAAMIMIHSFKYTTPLTVGPGATVSVMNMDDENHTVTSDRAGLFDDKATAGQTTTFTAPTTPGTYPYHCTYHSNMHGVLLVK
jgi:plastocyanin